MSEGGFLLAPLDGWAVALERVPDPVFAGKMLGQGIAIDPTGAMLVAPCAGEVLTIHAGRHALTLRSDDGVELLIHIGIDTVELGGDGFAPLVAEGARVAAGDPLIRFDLDRLVQRAPAVVTPILVTGKGISVEPLASGRVAAGEPLLRWTRDAAQAEAEAGGDVVTRRATVALPHGVHARPAARIGAAAKGFAIVLARGDKQAPADSAVRLLGLAIAAGDEIVISGYGAGVERALDAIAAILGEHEIDELASEPPAPGGTLPAATGGTILNGVRAARGIAFGLVHRLQAAQRVGDDQAGDPLTEQHRFDAALDAVRARLRANGGVFEAQAALLEDDELVAAVRAGIDAGHSAPAAVRAALGAAAASLEANGNRRIAERAADVRDVERQLVSDMTGASAPAAAEVAPGSILLADELLPSDVAALDPARVAGIVLARGGPTSHAAIIAAGKAIPMAVAFGDSLATIADGTLVGLDADRGTLEVDPPGERVTAYREALAARAESRASARAAAASPCRTADGQRIELFANLGGLADAELAVAEGAEGCGLLRTEFLFLDRASPPTREEQRTQYQAIADTLGERPFVIRLLDIGGDKPAPYAPIPAEENPALGQRGIRFALANPALLDDQLAAIRAVVPTGRARIMVPMVSSVDELDAVIERVGPGFEVGVMIETPAAAMIAPALSRRAAFLSIGTNDLTQYALAMDRGNAAIAASLDSLHPAVLALIAATCRGASTSGIPVAVCGDLAADPLGVPLLIGLGVTELSVPAGRLGDTRAAVARLSLADARALAGQALDCESAAAVRRLVEERGW
ncbi:phosphoenolpyruvate--protein phosphotransferase [Sphingomonas sp. ASV193]|uniref:phosphoenolpyruvate--protein phosphotransferase n=1 Tax=Sphingomonas sp. ASV193 TaxID=3144405 RepID=UPI0032E85FDA